MSRATRFRRSALAACRGTGPARRKIASSIRANMTEQYIRRDSARRVRFERNEARAEAALADSRAARSSPKRVSSPMCGPDRSWPVGRRQPCISAWNLSLRFERLFRAEYRPVSASAVCASAQIGKDGMSGVSLGDEVKLCDTADGLWRWSFAFRPRRLDYEDARTC